MHPEISAIQIRNHQRRVEIDLRAVEFFSASLIETLHLTNVTFSIVFAGTAAMRRLNRDWRGKDYATDVLSFAYEDELVEGKSFLGEIIIAPEIAVRQAIEYGVEPEMEIRKLLVHGILHLMGYDHEVDSGEMERMQKRILRRRFFMKPPLLAPMISLSLRGRGR